jgi:hypothetical protein
MGIPPRPARRSPSRKGEVKLGGVLEGLFLGRRGGLDCKLDGARIGHQGRELPMVVGGSRAWWRSNSLCTASGTMTSAKSRGRSSASTTLSSAVSGEASDTTIIGMPRRRRLAGLPPVLRLRSGWECVVCPTREESQPASFQPLRPPVPRWLPRPQTSLWPNGTPFDNLVPKVVYKQGIADLSRVERMDAGTFFYTWFKAVARKA